MKKLLLLAVIALFPVSSIAGESKAQGSGPNIYTECGIGAALFPNIGWAAVISNAIWDMGSTATTSAFSSPQVCQPKKVKAARLILETLPELEKDVASGEGKYLTALSETIGCDSSASNELNANIRQSYASVVSDENYGSKTRVERASDMYNTVKAASSARCSTTL